MQENLVPFSLENFTAELKENIDKKKEELKKAGFVFHIHIEPLAPGSTEESNNQETKDKTAFPKSEQES